MRCTFRNKKQGLRPHLSDKVLMRPLFAAILTFITLALLLAAAPPPAAPATSTSQPAIVPNTRFPFPPDEIPSPPGSRILKTFDFEERNSGNFESIPMFWSKVVGPGFPAYSSGKFDTTTYHVKENKGGNEGGAAGGTSFQLRIDGGSAAFRFNPGKLLINPNADFYILAYVKTTPLHHARAQLSAWFADEKDQLILQPAYHSAPYAAAVIGAAGRGAGALKTSTLSPPATSSSDDWHLIHLFVPGPSNPNAKSLVLQLGLLQPEQLATPTGGGPDSTNDNDTLGPFALYQQDLQGAAWFDDITIVQLPRLSISLPADCRANIFPPDTPVTLDLSVSDLANPDPAKGGEGGAASQLAASLKITDPDGMPVAIQKYAIAASSDATTPWTMQFKHPPLPPGLYVASLNVTDVATGSLIAARQTRFLCLAPPFSPLNTTVTNFGFSLPSYSDAPELWPLVPHLVRTTKAGLVQVPAWRRDMTEEMLLQRDPIFDSLLTNLQRLDASAIATFPELPSIIAGKLLPTAKPPAELTKPPAEPGANMTKSPDLLPPNSILALSQGDPTIWRPYLSFLLARYANRIDYWEFGSLDQPYSGNTISSHSQPGFVASDFGAQTSQHYQQLFAKTSAAMASLIDTNRVLVPWNALFDFDAKLYPNARLDLRLPNTLKPSQLPVYLDHFKQSSGTPVIAHIDPLDEKTLRHARLADFAHRLVYARSANPAAILIDLPLAPSTFTNAAVEPDEIILAYNTLIQAMGKANEVRELALAPDLKTFLVSKSNKDILILWSDFPDRRIDIDLPLGDSPRLTNLTGSTRPIALAPPSPPISSQTRLSHLSIPHAPVILDNIDSRPVQLRASFGLSRTTFPAGVGVVQTEVLLTNPYAETLAGTLRLSAPKGISGWSIEPALIPVSLAAGRSLRYPVIIRYPFSQYAGTTSINARFSVEGGPSYDFTAPIAIKSETVELDCSAQFLSNGDLVIQQVITNISNANINAQAYVLVPGFPRDQRYILDLAPRQTIIKRFILSAASYVSSTAPPSPHPTAPANLSAVLADQTAAVGIRDNNGQTLITKALPLK